MTKAHTQTSIVVYVTYYEKAAIKEWAQKKNKSMSRYFLDLFYADYTDSSFGQKQKKEIKNDKFQG